VAPPAPTGTGEAAATTTTHTSLKTGEKNIWMMKKEDKRNQRSEISSIKVSLILKKLKIHVFFNQLTLC
jgi:hypothetical protein